MESVGFVAAACAAVEVEVASPAILLQKDPVALPLIPLTPLKVAK